MKLSQILEADLISNEKVSEKYWENYSEEISKKLWLPQLTDSQDLDRMNCLPTSFKNSRLILQSLITNESKTHRLNLPKTYYQLSQYFPPDTMEDAIITVTRKVRFYPNKPQRELLNKCFGAHRYFYNRTIERINNKIKLNKSEIVPRNKTLIDNDIWMKEIPLDTREYGMRKALDAYKTSLALLKQGKIKHFKLSYLSRKYNTQVCYVDKRALNNGLLFPQKLKENAKLFAKKDKRFLKKSLGTFPIIRENDGKYYACVLINKIVRKFEKENTICALDPGVRTFQTLYSEKEIIEFGYKTQNQIRKLYNKIDNYTSKITKKKSHVKHTMKRKCAKWRTKIQHIIRDLHWKVCNYLTNEYDVILLPVFKTQEMTSKDNKKIKKCTRREMLQMSHYKFKEKLKYKCKIRNKTVIICKENYTTKTCGSCGKINNNLGGQKIFKCDCGIKVDRDVNGSRNILIRSLTKLQGSMMQLPSSG